MSILVDQQTKVVVQGITGRSGRLHTEFSMKYGTNIVAGVTPGRGGEEVCGVPVYDTVHEAVENHQATASVFYVPAKAVKTAFEEAIDAGIKLIVGTSEGISRQKAAFFRALATQNDARLIGFNTTGILSAGKCKLGGIGGEDSDYIYVPGRIGVCSRSGGMGAELALALKRGGYGVSTVVCMGGDWIVGTPMVEYVKLFQDDPDTDAILLFCEPGTDNEAELAEHLAKNGLKKPIVALMAGAFQENYPKGVSFGHAAAMIAKDSQTISAKKKMLSAQGVEIVASLIAIPEKLKAIGIEPHQGL